VTEPAPEHSVVLYSRGPAWNPGQPLGQQEGAEDRIGFLVKGLQAGVVERARPFHGADDLLGDDELVGLAIYRLDRAQADERTRRDPAVRTGLLRFRARAWHP
jgi:hypothetical protein